MIGWLTNFFRRSRTRNATRGAAGEEIAARFLQRERGFRIVARNWQSPRDRRAEIDLVCRDGDALVFVEVKTRDAEALVPGYFAVTRRKKRAMRRACQAYVARLPRTARTFRFDVVQVSLPADGAADRAVVRHFDNIPLFSKDHWG